MPINSFPYSNYWNSRRWGVGVMTVPIIGRATHPLSSSYPTSFMGRAALKKTPGDPVGMYWRPEGDRIFLPFGGGEIAITNPSTITLDDSKNLISLSTNIKSFCVLHDTPSVIIGDETSQLHFASTNLAPQNLVSVAKVPSSITVIESSPSERCLYLALQSQSPFEWDLSKSKKVSEYSDLDYGCSRLRWHPRRSIIVGASTTYEIHLWDPKSNDSIGGSATLAFSNDHKESIVDLQWHPTRDYIFSSLGKDLILKVWDLRSSGGLDSHRNPEQSYWKPLYECGLERSNNENQLIGLGYSKRDDCVSHYLDYNEDDTSSDGGIEGDLGDLGSEGGFDGDGGSEVGSGGVGDANVPNSALRGDDSIDQCPHEPPVPSATISTLDWLRSTHIGSGQKDGWEDEWRCGWCMSPERRSLNFSGLVGTRVYPTASRWHPLNPDVIAVTDTSGCLSFWTNDECTARVHHKLQDDPSFPSVTELLWHPRGDFLATSTRGVGGSGPSINIWGPSVQYAAPIHPSLCAHNSHLG